MRLPSLRVILVDDERIARLSLRALLSQEEGVEIVDEATTAAEAVASVSQWQPDAVFLDIQLPDGSGLDVVERFKSAAKIIFVSVSDAYALRAFEINALDYLHKPVEPERLHRTLQRLRNPAQAPLVPARLAENDLAYLEHEQGQLFIRAEEILWIESQGNYSRVFTQDKRQFQMRRSLNEWESRLDPVAFIRISRTALIRVRSIERIEMHADGGAKVRLLRWAIPLEVSRRAAAELKRVLK